MSNVVAVVQARMGSTRFPGKVMQPIGGVPLIELLLTRLSRSRRINRIVVATSTDPRNAPLVRHVGSLGYAVFQGSEDDVLDRYYRAAQPYAPDVVVRITGDCPLIDAQLVDCIIDYFFEQKVDYASNVEPPSFPDGLDTEVFTFAALARAWSSATCPEEREHVTMFIRRCNAFRRSNYSSAGTHAGERWTVDEPADLQVVRAICEHFGSTQFSWRDVLDLRVSNPCLFEANQSLTRNEGAALGTGQKLWKRAKRIIPGGNMLLSKRPEMFLPEQWPAYFSKAKGCRIWDLDGREYVDMSIMGVGTNTLGYGHSEVDDAVREAVANGNMSSLNCPEEVYLAERLIELHPWADMVRLARTGGEANAIAVRIARAASGRDKVAFCGYHGWHDWYLAANLGDEKSLAGHLLPGLEPNGVPQYLRGSVLPFNYNHFEELEALVRDHDIGVIMMEVVRNVEPADDFLKKVRRLATEKGIVLAFDECTSGFRQTLGGLHKHYGVEPDVAMFGKTLGNGYAITAVLGRREVMEHAQSTFISSTFWTERIGPAAALKTLEVMERTASYEQITRIGGEIGARWRSLGAKHGIEVQTGGLPAMIAFNIDSASMRAYKTLISQEMLKHGFLAGTSVYVCTEHRPEILEKYFDRLDAIFAMIGECERGRPVGDFLTAQLCDTGFRRLN